MSPAHGQQDLTPNSNPKPRHRRVFPPDTWPVNKTVDIGRNGVTVCADPYGGIYQISAPTPHRPHYALMIAAPWEQFDPCQRQNPAAVRWYRKKMENRLGAHVRGQGLRLFDVASPCAVTDGERGVHVDDLNLIADENDIAHAHHQQQQQLGLLPGAVLINHVQTSLGSHVQYEYETLDQALFVQTALCVRQDGTIIQASQVTNISSTSASASASAGDSSSKSGMVSLPVTLDLTLAVSRASYGQLTDQGEVAMPSPANTMHREWANGGRTPVYCIGNEGLAQQITAYGVFYNVTTGKYSDTAGQDIFCQEEFGGQDANPPSKLAALRKTLKPQVLNIAPGETLRLACVLRAEESGLDEDGKRMAPWVCRQGGVEEFDAEHVMPASLFAHEDGVSDPRMILARYRRTVLQETGSEHNDQDGREMSLESCILWSNVNYIIGCCSAPVKSGAGRKAVAVVADHVALPLGWPRDNYWQLRLLQNMQLRGFDNFFPNNSAKAEEYARTVHGILRGHLEWLFTVAQVGGGGADGEDNGSTSSNYWRRSYLISGMPKDRLVYQLDTQLYPFLQLCEYHQAFSKDKDNTKGKAKVNDTNIDTVKRPSPTPSAASSSSSSTPSLASTSTSSSSLPTFTSTHTNPSTDKLDTINTKDPSSQSTEEESHTAFIHRLLSTRTFRLVLADLISRIDPTTHLFTTDETPADDDTSEFPFHMSSNLLAWYTLKSVADLLDEFGVYSEQRSMTSSSLSSSASPFRSSSSGEVNGDGDDGDIGVDSSPPSPRTIRSLCNALRAAMYKYLTCECPDSSGERMFAYAMGRRSNTADVQGKAVTITRTYHDGNDMPTLFAHEWGFLQRCSADANVQLGGDRNEEQEDDPLWRRIWEKTLEWAFTPDPEYHLHRRGSGSGLHTLPSATIPRKYKYNTGYAASPPSPFHGLGSDHSPGSWTLGLYQEWRFAQLTDNSNSNSNHAARDREASAWKRIQGAMQWDGTFSEAVDVESGLCTSKTWFSWPGAMIGEGLIGKVVEQMEQQQQQQRQHG